MSCSASSSITFGQKDPGDTSDYLFDFSNVIAAGDTLNGQANIVFTPAGLTIVESAIQPGKSGASKAIAARLSGGAPAVTYQIQVTVPTAGGDTFVRSAYLPVQYR